MPTFRLLSTSFVVTTPRINVNSKVKFRTYHTRIETASPVTVIEALTATCATPPAFEYVSFGPIHCRQEYISGVVGAANPIRELIAEAYGKFREDARAATIVSFGSGNLGILASPIDGDTNSWAKITHSIAIDCEQAAQEIESQMGHLGIYFRFSVEQGLQDVYNDITGDLGRMTAQACAYLEEQAISRRIDHCVKSLRLRQGMSTLGQLSKHIFWRYVSLSLSRHFQGILVAEFPFTRDYHLLRFIL